MPPLPAITRRQSHALTDTSLSIGFERRLAWCSRPRSSAYHWKGLCSPRPDRQPRRDRGPRDPRAARARHRGRRRLLDRGREARCTSGSPTAPSASGPPPPTESYLRIPSVIAAATTTRCEAIHPGYGFLSENPAFAAACADNDLVFVGPTAETMARDGRQGGGQAGDARGGRAARAGHRRRGDARRGARAAPTRSGYPGAAQGRRGRRRARHAPGRRPRRARRRVPRRPPPRRRRRSATARSTSRRRSSPRGTSRSRCSATATAACSRSASASARSSAATRS